MNPVRRLCSRLAHDCNGSALIEFAILAPALLTMVMGVFAVGMFSFSQNALNSVASDTARYTVVEYQKSDKITDEQIQSKAVALAVNAPYGLDIDRINAVVSRPATNIAGTTEYLLTMTYTPYNPIAFTGIHAPVITSTRTFYVAI